MDRVQEIARCAASMMTDRTQDLHPILPSSTAAAVAAAAVAADDHDVAVDDYVAVHDVADEGRDDNLVVVAIAILLTIDGTLCFILFCILLQHICYY